MAKKLTPFRAVAEGLAIIGKPFYFLVSRLVIGIIFLLYVVGRGLAKIRVPKFGKFFKLEGLKISLFELKMLSKFKKLFVRKITRFQKLKFKKRAGFLITLFLVLSLVFYFYFFIVRTLPSPRGLERHEPEVSTKIYDRNGNLLYKIYKDQNRTIVPLTQIPPQVRFATLAAEDAEFYSHPGFSVRGIFRALTSDIQTGSLQGGSTITQQLVKNVLLSPEKTLTRKIKELILSVEVEETYTKDQILTMYLNEVSYGGTAYGIEEASESYFGKSVRDLDLAEAALLAGLPKSPTAYSPFGQNPISAIERQREVLHLMLINKFITSDEEQKALDEKLTLVSSRKAINAPHFVMYVRQLLVDKFGEDMVDKGGLEVTTSLDLPVQEMAEMVVKNEVANLKGLNVGNGAALVINPQTGEILAMVGSKDYFDTAYDGQVNVTTSLRQPGSSIKVVNYAYALAHGYTPATIINDSPITYVTPGTTPYSPVNYDGQFRGNITLRSALAESRNIPAVKVLASYGVSNMVNEGDKMGITTWGESSNYGLSLTLGGGAVKMVDLADVYASIADFGKRPTLMPILQVKDYKGKVLEKDLPKTEQVLDPRVAFLLTDILKDNSARAPEFGLNSYLVIKGHPEVAVKTGTSNDLRDNWTVGFNQNFLVATWVGNNNNSPMSHIASGVTGASPIWNKIISTLLSGQTSVDWKIPSGLIHVNCLGKGEWFLEDTIPGTYCKQTPSPTPISGNKILDSGATTHN